MDDGTGVRVEQAPGADAELRAEAVRGRGELPPGWEQGAAAGLGPEGVLHKPVPRGPEQAPGAEPQLRGAGGGGAPLEELIEPDDASRAFSAAPAGSEIKLPKIIEGDVIQRTKVDTFENRLPNGETVKRKVTVTEHIRPISKVTDVSGVEKLSMTEQLIGKEIQQEVTELAPGITDPDAPGLEKVVSNEDFEESLPDGTWVLNHITRTRVGIPKSQEPQIIEGEVEQRSNVETFEEKQPNGVTVVRKVTTVEHVRPIVEITYEDGAQHTSTIEQLVGREVEEDVLELPPGVTDATADGLARETATADFEETLPDGSWLRKRINNTKVSVQEPPKIIEGEVEHRTHVDTSEEKLPNGGLRRIKVTTTDHIRPITEVAVVDGTEDVHTVEKFEGRAVHEEITDLPPGIRDANAPGTHKETSVDAHDEVLPDGTWENKKVTKTVVKFVETKPTIIEGAPKLKTSVESHEEKLPDGSLVITNVTTTDHVKPITTLRVVQGVEKKDVVEELVGREVERDVTQLPPGVTDPHAPGLKAESAVEEFQETLPNGVWQKTRVKKTTAKLAQQTPPQVTEGQVKLKTHVETFKEPLPDGGTLTTKRTTIEHVKPVTEVVTVDGVQTPKQTEHFIGKEIIDDITELPFGVIEPLAQGVQAKTSVDESEKTLPDGTWEKHKVNKTVVVAPAPQVTQGDVQHRVSVDTFQERLDDGTLVVTKVTTVDHVRPVTETVTVQGVPKSQTREKFEGREIMKEITEMPPGITDPEEEGVEKETSTQNFSEVKEDGTWEKTKISKTKTKKVQTEPTIIEGSKVLKTGVESFEEDLPSGGKRLTEIKTTDHVKPVTELLVVKGVEKKKVTEHLIGREIDIHMTDLPPGVTDAEGLKSRTAVEESDRTLPDGTWEKKRIQRTTVKLPEQAPPTEEGVQLRTNVENFEEKLEDGTMLFTKITTVDHVRPAEKKEGEKQPVVEELVGREIHRDVMELPPGVRSADEDGVETETNVDAFQHTRPDGAWEKEHVTKTKVKPVQVEPIIIVGHPVLKSSIETFVDKLDNGTTRVIDVKTTDHIKPTTELLVVKGVEKKKVTEELIGREIEEHVTLLPPGVTSREGLKSDTKSEEFDRTLPNGAWEKKVVKTETVQVPEQGPPKFEEGDIQLKTHVETFKEHLPDGGTLLKQITTIEHIKPVTEIVTIDGVQEKDVSEQFVGREVIEDITELPFGVIDPVSEGLSTESSVQLSEQTLPDGTWEKKKVHKTTVVSQVAPQVVAGELEHRTNVETFQEKRPDGTLLITKVTTTDHVRPFSGTVMVQGRPQQQTLERLEGREIDQQVMQLAPGVENPDSDGVEKAVSVEASEHVLPDGTWEAKRVTTTKATPSQTQPTIIEGSPVLKTSVQTLEDKLKDGGVKVTTVKTTDHVKPITEVLVIKGKEKKKVTEKLIGREIEEDVKLLPPGVTDATVQGLEAETAVKEFEGTTRDGVWEKRTVKTTTVKAMSASAAKVTEGEVEKRTNVETFEDALPDGGVVRKKVTTVDHVRPVTEVRVVNNKEQKTTRLKPVGKEVEEDIVELPAGVTDPDAPGLGKETSIQQSEQTLASGTWEKRVVKRTKITGTPTEMPPLLEGQVAKRTTIQSFEETLPDGSRIVKKITTTEHIKPVPVVRMVKGVQERVTREEVLGRVIEEDITRLPRGVRDPRAEGLETDTSVEEFEESLPDGSWVKKIIRRTEVTSSTDQAPPTEITARPAQAPAQQMQGGESPTKAKISMGAPQLQPPKKDVVMPEDALDVEEEEFEETLPDGTVINKRIITTRTATTITRTIVTVMPDGSMKEEVIRETVSGSDAQRKGEPDAITDEIIPEEMGRPEAGPPPRAPPRPVDDDDIVPEQVTDAERAPPTPKQRSVDEGEVVPHLRDKPDSLPPVVPTLSGGVPVSQAELDEVEETLPDGTVVKRRAMKTKVRKIITKKIRRVGPDGEVIEDVFTEEVPESDISETSSIRSGLSESARDVVSPIPCVSSPTELASPSDSIDSEKPSVRVYTDTIEGEPQVETDVQEFEETMPDGTVVKRKVIKTRQKQTIVKRVVMEGPESDLPTTEEQAQMMLNASDSFDPEVQVYTDRMQTEPVETTDVQEFEETLPDGTVVKKKVTTKTEQQLKTERTLMEGSDAVIGLTDGVDEDAVTPESQQYAHSAPPARQPQAGNVVSCGGSGLLHL